MIEDFLSDNAVFRKVQTKPTAKHSKLGWTRLLKEKVIGKHKNK